MNGYKQFLHNSACFATDDPSGGGAPADPGPVDNTALFEPPVPAEPAAPEPEAAKEPDPPPPDKEPEKEPWQKVRFAEITRQRHDAERRAALAEQRAAELEAKLKPPTDPTQRDTQERLYTRAELEAASKQEAQKIAQQQMQQAAIERIRETGSAEYTPAAFNAACNTLADLGANEKPDFLALVTDLPNAHAVLHRLGGDPDEAMRVLSLPPLRMALALAQVSAKAAAPVMQAAPPAPKPVSKAPEPITPIRGAGAVVETDPDKMTMEQYAKWRKYAK